MPGARDRTTATQPSLPFEPDRPRERALALLVHERLSAEYRAPLELPRPLDPVSRLVGALLSHRTRNADSRRAYLALRERFDSWEAVRDAPVELVREAIAPCTWPEQKAPRLQLVLREVTRRRGELSLDFLGSMSVTGARVWLEAIPGVGPKTSASVLLFSRLRMPAMPVDSHHHRVAERLGLVAKGTPVGPSHERLESLLPRAWGVQELYDHHEVLMLHGQRRCHFAAPACGGCVLAELCPSAQRPANDDASK